jgi:hypothetical protein
MLREKRRPYPRWTLARWRPRRRAEGTGAPRRASWAWSRRGTARCARLCAYLDTSSMAGPGGGRGREAENSGLNCGRAPVRRIWDGAVRRGMGPWGIDLPRRGRARDLPRSLARWWLGEARVEWVSRLLLAGAVPYPCCCSRCVEREGPKRRDQVSDVRFVKHCSFSFCEGSVANWCHLGLGWQYIV